MVVTLAMTVLGAAGIAFYLRFMAALYKESKPHVGGYWMRLKVDAGEDVNAEPKERKATTSHAA